MVKEKDTIRDSLWHKREETGGHGTSVANMDSYPPCLEPQLLVINPPRIQYINV
jgi:hypothetical protein